MRVLPLVLMVLLVSANAQAKRIAVIPQEAPRQAAQEFYHWVLTHKFDGLPSSREMAHLKPMLSPPVAILMERAREVEKQCIKATPRGNKPPVYEGSLLVGNYDEVADEVILAEPRVRSGEATVSAQMFVVNSHYPKASPERITTWTDQLNLHFDGAKWVVADIVFKEKKSLVKGLEQYIAELQYCAGGK